MADPRATDPARERIAEITNWSVSRCWSTEMQRTTDALTAVLDLCCDLNGAIPAGHNWCFDQQNSNRIRTAIATSLGVQP